MVNKKKHSSLSIILAAGGTGGHLFPAIALAEELAKNEINTHLITDLRCKKYLPEILPAKLHIIDIHLKMSSLFNKVRSCFKLITACAGSLWLVSKIKPDIVVGFGGYPSFPILFASIILRIPIAIHEQNCFIGKTNRFFAKYAKIIALSYNETINANSYDKSKILVTGNMVRSSISNLPSKYDPYSTAFNIFVFGGSQGANIFCTLMPATLKELIKLNPKTEIGIIQQASQAQQYKLAEEYSNMGVKFELQEFFHNIEEIYAKTQLIISRSGSSTVFEAMTAGVPAIFIPLPFAMEDHQFFNAKSLSDKAASWYYRQEDVIPTLLAQKLYQLITDRELLFRASKNLSKLQIKNAASNLSDTLIKIIS